MLVTGATGFIGRRLTAALLAQQRRVIVLTRDRLAARAQFGAAPLIVESLDELPDELELDAIVNLAGASVAGGLWTASAAPRAAGEPGRDHPARSPHFVARLRRTPGVLVNGSAVGFYGDGGQMLLDESDVAGPGFMAELCAAWEAEAARMAALGTRVCVLRLGLVLDWTGGILPMLALPARLGLGARLGDGRQWAPWIHRDDAVRMILAAIDDPAWRGPVNAVAPDLVTQGEMTRRLAVHFRRPQWLAAPAWLPRLALGEFSDLFLASQRVLPERGAGPRLRLHPPDPGAGVRGAGRPAAAGRAAGSWRHPSSPPGPPKPRRSPLPPPRRSPSSCSCTR